MIQKTSLEAFQVLKPDLDNRQRIVYRLIHENKGLCNHDISHILGWEINSVTPRVKELRDMGLVVCSHEKQDPSTNRTVMCWKVVNNR